MVPTMGAYHNVKIPRVLADEIERVIRQYPGYRSVSEFVIDAIRRRIEEVKRFREVVE